VQAEPVSLFARPVEAVSYDWIADALRVGAVQSQLVGPPCKGCEVNSSDQAVR